MLLGLFKNDINESDGVKFVRSNIVMEKIEELLKNNNIIFEPDYLYSDYIREEDAEKIIILLSSVK